MNKFLQILFLLSYTYLFILTTIHYHIVDYYSYNSFTAGSNHSCDSLVCDVCLIAHTQENYTHNLFIIDNDIVGKLIFLNVQVYYLLNFSVDLTRAPPIQFI